MIFRKWKYNKWKENTNLWIPPSLSYTQLFAMHFDIIEIIESPGTHQWWLHQQSFIFYIQQKGLDQGIGRRGLWLVSLGQLWEIDWWESCCQDAWQTLDDLIKEPH